MILEPLNVENSNVGFSWIVLKCLPGDRYRAADKGILPFLLFGKSTKARFLAGNVNALRQLGWRHETGTIPLTESLPLSFSVKYSTNSMPRLAATRSLRSPPPASNAPPISWPNSPEQLRSKGAKSHTLAVSCADLICHFTVENWAQFKRESACFASVLPALAAFWYHSRALP